MDDSENTRNSRNRAIIIVGAIFAALFVIGQLTNTDAFNSRSSAGAVAERRCAESWDAAKIEGERGGGSDVELRRTLAACPDYPTWQRNMDRVGGQSPNTLAAACILHPNTQVCRDAAARGVDLRPR